ncbi:MAG: Hpt domain-containing protein [Burkholderiales bacterium]|nr:Hpt domain-containing protein [Burkholderiales bacterium]
MGAEQLHSGTSLVWLKGEIDRSVAAARQALAGALSRGEARERPLLECAQHMRQVRGAIAIVSLEGAARFCAAIEDAVRHAASAPAKLTHVNASVLDRAMFALCQYLDDLAKGELDVPLKLFPVYRELNELSGRDGVSELDLFFPDVSAAPPRTGQPSAAADDDVGRHVAHCRAVFQRGFLLWLKQPGLGQGPRMMRAALDAVAQVAHALAAPPGLWWAAGALIDVLLHPSGGDAPTIRSTLGRIERLMRDVATGEAMHAPVLMREVLYPLALCPALSQRVREVKQLYRLDAQVPEFCVSGTLEYDQSALAPVLDDMRRRLSAVEDSWARYTAGSGQHLRQLREHIGALKATARDLGHYRLVRLLDVVALIGSKLPDLYPSPNEVLALEMAAAFLFMEGMLDHFTSPPPDIDQQVAVMIGWLLDAVKPRGDAGTPAGAARDDITQRRNYHRIRGQVAREILENLHQIEQSIDQIARNPGTAANLASLEASVRQIAGALKMLGLSRANGVLSACLHLMKLSVSDDAALTRASLEWVADGLSCLGFYVQAMQHGDTPNEDILLGFVQRLAREDAHPAGATGWVPPAETSDADALGEADALAANAPPQAYIEPGDAPAPADTLAAPAAEGSPIALDASDMQGIYVEEANDVLASMDALLARLDAAPSDLDALATLRRGFHTLKGSARLVGLDDLGHVAWQLERTLDFWLELRPSVSSEVVQLIEDAVRALRGSIAELGAGWQIDLRAYPAIIDRAELLRSQDEAAGASANDGSEAAAANDAVVEAPAAAQVVIGEVTLSETLFQIYLRETTAHLATLDTELDRAERDPDQPLGEELTRAAHTLTSSSRTTGFAAVAELACALEECLQQLNGTGPGAALVGELRATRTALAEMLVEVRDKRSPCAAPDRAYRLSAAARAAMEAAAARVAAATSLADEAASAHASDELDPQLLPLFLDEAHRLMPQIGAQLESWRRRRADLAPARSIARALHTLKGSARMAGAMHVGALTHAMESRVGMAIEDSEQSDALFAALRQELDAIAEAIDALDAQELDRSRRAAESSAQDPADEAASALTRGAATLRIDASVLDALLDRIDALGSARARAESEIDTLKQSLEDLAESVARLRTQLRETQLQADSQMQSRLDAAKPALHELDPLELDRYTRLQELTRMMAESLHDVQVIQQGLVAGAAESAAAIGLQHRLAREVQQQLIELRSVPFGTLTERLQRTVRQAARLVERDAALAITGEAIEIDRGILQRVAAPLEHMLRNAMAHGIEAREERLALGKPTCGQIRLALEQNEHENVLTLADDGAGLDPASIQLEALRLGLIAPGDRPPDAALFRMIFTPGFSTARSITATSGRGIGLDVVRSELAAIGGSIEVSSLPGQGASFRIRFPLALAQSQALLVRSGAASYAIPASLVEHVFELPAEALAAAYAERCLAWNGERYRLHYLPRLLGQAEPTDVKRSNTLLLLRSGEHRLALHVDQALRKQEIVLKALGPQLARVPGLQGATLLSHGQVVLVIDPLQLHGRGQLGPPDDAMREIRPNAAETAAHVLVVDDSLTVRRLTGRLLMRAGYRVSSAKDGIEALAHIQQELPDVVILDIEMPRMDGFELTRHLRADARTAGIPIILVTSRLAERHQRRALDLGVDACFGKPYPEDELTACVADLLGRRPAERAA